MPYKTALALLTRRDHSRKELIQKLLKKNFALADIQQALDQLSTEKLFNENRFVENFIHYKRNRGYGPVHIHAALLEKGIDETLIQSFLSPKDPQWFTHAQQVWKKRFKNKIPKDFKSRAQQMRFLQYRGFTQEQITKIFQSDD